MFKPNWFVCCDCNKHSLVVVKAGLCAQCNEAYKREKKGLSKVRAPIKKVSDKRAKADIVYYALRDVFLKQHPICMINIPDICSHQPSNQVHHSYSGKDREKYYLDTATWFATEQCCHDWVHLHPIEAREQGYLK